MLNELLEYTKSFWFPSSDPYRSVLEHPIQFWPCSDEDLNSIPEGINSSYKMFFESIGCGVIKKSKRGNEGKYWKYLNNTIVSPSWAKQMMVLTPNERDDESSENECHFHDGSVPILHTGDQCFISLDPDTGCIVDMVGKPIAPSITSYLHWLAFENSRPYSYPVIEYPASPN